MPSIAVHPASRVANGATGSITIVMGRSMRVSVGAMCRQEGDAASRVSTLFQ